VLSGATGESSQCLRWALLARQVGRQLGRSLEEKRTSAKTPKTSLLTHHVISLGSFAAMLSRLIKRARLASRCCSVGYIKPNSRAQRSICFGRYST